MRNSVPSLGAIAVAAGVLLGVATPAQSRVVLTLTAGGTILSCDSSLAVTASNCSTAAGFSISNVGGTGVFFTGNINGFSVTMTSGVANIPGTAAGAELNGSSTSVNRTGTGQGTLTIDYSGYSYLYPDGANKLLSGSASLSANNWLGGVGGDTVVSSFAARADNTLPSLVSAVGNPFTSCSMAPASSGTSISNNCVAAQQTWADTASTTFSMRSVQTFTLSSTRTANTSFSTLATAVPEPMSLSLVGAGLLGAALVSRRRNKAA
jgi:hypothetical protein